MGPSSSIPGSNMEPSSSIPAEFVTVLADKQVKTGGEIILRCEANLENLTATWEKDGNKLICVDGKHIINNNGRSFEMTIKNAEEGDEGNYTINLKNSSGSIPCSAMVTVELNEWRKVQWKQDQLIRTLKTFKPTSDKVKEFRFLLYGPNGAGKSAIVNTIKSIFEGRVSVLCPTASEVTQSYTKKYEKYQIGNTQDGLSLTFSDTMGVEPGEGNGVHMDDIISALKGHILEGYTFNCRSPLTEDNKYYRNNPSLQDRVHCLVIVIPADKFPIIKDGDSIKKMKMVRERASTMGIPQVVFMTRVDLACPLTMKDLHNVYKSSKIKRKIRECSVTLGVPENCIFPVCNYHRDTDMREDINCLMLDALTKILPWADDYIVGHSNK